MPSISPRRIATTIPLVLAGAALASALAGVSAAAPRHTPTASSAAPQHVTGFLLSRQPHTLARGTKVSSRSLGQRVFLNAKHGFALADTGQAQYPAETRNAGKTWRTDGPALHLNAAQAPFAVTEVGAANAHTFYAFGSGQVADVTGDGGRHWYRTNLGELVVAVVPGGGNRVVAYAQASRGSTATTSQYVTHDGGHHWSLSTRLGGGF